MPAIRNFDLDTDCLGSYDTLYGEKEDFRPWLVNMLHHRVLTDGQWKMHVHTDNECLIPEKGDYHCLLDNEELIVHPGELLLIQQGQRHEDYMQQGMVNWAIHFLFRPLEGGSPCPNIFRQGTTPRQQVISFSPPSLWTDFLKQMKAEKSNTPYGSFRIHNAIFELFLRRCLMLFPRESLQPIFSQEIVMDRQVDQLYAAFMKNLKCLPSLEDLCAQLHISRSALNRFCLSRFNLPPCKAFMHFKMLRVQEYLQAHPEQTIKSVSELFGFSNQSHFSRAFFRELSYWPSQGKR